MLWSQVSANRRPDSLSSTAVDYDSQVDEKALSALKKKKKGKKKPRKPRFKMPQPPASTAPPGPAYSNQPFTFLSYTQYFANLTQLEAETTRPEGQWQVWHQVPARREYQLSKDNDIDQKKSESILFRYDVEYDTRTDKIYKLRDMTIRSYLDLARRIAKKKIKSEQLMLPTKSVHRRNSGPSGNIKDEDENLLERDTREPKQGEVAVVQNKAWRAFLCRAFAGYFDNDELLDIDAAS
jgi:endopolyphosphatase